MRAFISLKNSMFCVQGQFPKDSLEEWGWGFGGNLPMGLGQKQLDEMPFFHMQTVAKKFVYALSWLDNPNTIKPASALGSGFCHCQSLWYSEEMLAQEGQQSLISKCIWNPLSLLLEPLQNHSGYKPFFFPFSGCITVTKTSTTDSFSRETLASVVQRLSMLGPGGGNCISLESPSGCRLSSAAAWEQEAIAGCSFSGECEQHMVFCVWHKWLISTSFSVVSATLGLEGTGSLQFPPISLKVTFQVSAFVLLFLFQRLYFAWT